VIVKGQTVDLWGCSYTFFKLLSNVDIGDLRHEQRDSITMTDMRIGFQKLAEQWSGAEAIVQYWWTVLRRTAPDAHLAISHAVDLHKAWNGKYEDVSKRIGFCRVMKQLEGVKRAVGSGSKLQWEDHNAWVRSSSAFMKVAIWKLTEQCGMDISQAKVPELATATMHLLKESPGEQHNGGGKRNTHGVQTRHGVAGERTNVAQAYSHQHPQKGINFRVHHVTLQSERVNKRRKLSAQWAPPVWCEDAGADHMVLVRLVWWVAATLCAWGCISIAAIGAQKLGAAGWRTLG
jgi:hypothetical protein